MLKDNSHLSDPELLSAADGELAPRLLREVRAHLETCWVCRTRMAQLQGTIGSFVANYRSVFDAQLPPEERSAAWFTARLSQHAPRAINSGSFFPPPSLSRLPWRAWTPLCLLALLLMGLFTGHLFQSSGSLKMPSVGETPIVPDPRLTPGEAALVSKTDVCQGNMQAEQRRIPEALRQAVLAEYGVKGAPQQAYEVDFLITPELGGSTSIRNLWPQPYFGRTWNAHVKDALEQRLHALVCSGDLDLSTAQREIASNWVDAYRKYVRTEDPM